VAASSGASGVTPSTSASKIPAVKTKTGAAAVICRQDCQRAFVSCKKTTRRIRNCRRAKKQCVSGCGVVNPNR
jgi:hypothetical protein